ncbi:diguanylate cyclase (GGDEF)-like protein/PAS domain S-box-containing protein [Aminobacter aganoensis]|uniref:Diguanylate cyclase (GGDEF)-like protein/PAS domain S-box-containing protein n=1 Tax=Aminobacter aganoensis TaxID=83264 RepID=A0A7X0FDY3_9HYPH|nr:EAL domain-containing protein [Aminobacter aganoensis]MBB6357574.1 diguanylate cyclase (GGDEF)-like protein/PAS domain S-box-containing protein [Aminobacter aganoensis]
MVIAASAAFQLGPDLLEMGTDARGHWAMSGWILSPALAGMLCLWASMRSQRTDRQAWGNLAAGCLLWAAGTIVWNANLAAFPGPGDAAYLFACLFFVVGMFRYTVGERAISLVKVCDFAIAASAVSLALLIAFRGHLEASPLPGFGKAVAFLYPVCGFAAAAFGLTCLALHASARRRPATRLLVIAATLHASADLFYGLSELDGGYTVGMEYDALWLASYLMISWAATEHIARLRAAPVEANAGRRWAAEALVPALAVGIVAVAWLATQERVGAMLWLSGTAAIALPFLIGVREHLVLRGERELKIAAHASREELSSVLESTTDSVIVLDPNWILTYVNGRAASLLGHAGLKPGANLWDLFPEEVGGAFHQAYRRAVDTQEPVQLEGRLLALGKWLEVHAYPSTDKLTIFFRDITERRRSREEIHRLAMTDSLTGLNNRVVFRERLREKVASESVAVIVFDLDTFKEVNDTHGHPVGDEVLVRFGERMLGCAGDALVARLGGDEFAVIVGGGRKEAEAFAERVVVAIADPFEVSVGPIEMRASMGIALAPDNGRDPDEVFKKADIALFSAKAHDPGRFHFFEQEMEVELLRMQSLKADLAKALPKHQFETVYQPILSLRDNSVRGFETLIRWRHPERGMVPPDEFIPVIEETGAIADIGGWVLDEALRSAGNWPDRISVAVNLSPCQFRGEGLQHTVRAALAKSGVAPPRLELEITESVLLQGSERNLALLHSLRNMGVKIALDDFGVGYSSLSYLRTFPFTRVKIDRSFVKGIDANPQSIAIVKSVVDIAAAMGMQVTAEGIETRQEFDCIRTLGCDAVQGFFIGRPTARGTELAALEKVDADMIWRATGDSRLPGRG